MKVSLLGPTNVDRLSTVILNKSKEEINKIANNTGKILGQNKCQLVVVFNYSGILKLMGDACKANGGKLEMLYTENDYDWYTDIYIDNLKEADIKTKKDSWHDMLLSLIRNSDLVICAGLAPGVFTELGYIKWDLHEKRGD